MQCLKCEIICAKKHNQILLPCQLWGGVGFLRKGFFVPTSLEGLGSALSFPSGQDYNDQTNDHQHDVSLIEF